MAAAHDSVATAIVRGQMKLMGAVAISLARKVTSVDVDDDGAATIAGDGDSAIEDIVREYSALTGQLGVRMCFDSAKDELRSHPDVRVPSFSSLQ